MDSSLERVQVKFTQFYPRALHLCNRVAIPLSPAGVEVVVAGVRYKAWEPLVSTASHHRRGHPFGVLISSIPGTNTPSGG